MELVFFGQGLGVNTIGAVILRIGFGGPLYCNYNREPPKTLF